MESEPQAEPSTQTFERIAREALASIPEPMAQHLTDVVLKVEDFATGEQLHSVGLYDKWQLTGLYEGRPVSEQSIWDPSDLPPVISLFRQPLLREWEQTGVELDALIRHVVIHEAGHHFGFSDDDMHALEDSAD